MRPLEDLMWSDLKCATIHRNDELLAEMQASVARSTRHIEIALPVGVQYEPGDHLEVAPENAPTLVEALASSM